MSHFAIALGLVRVVVGKSSFVQRESVRGARESPRRLEPPKTTQTWGLPRLESGIWTPKTGRPKIVKIGPTVPRLLLLWSVGQTCILFLVRSRNMEPLPELPKLPAAPGSWESCLSDVADHELGFCKCGICHGPAMDPVVLEPLGSVAAGARCGHLFCSTCASSSLAAKNECPVCRVRPVVVRRDTRLRREMASAVVECPAAECDRSVEFGEDGSRLREHWNQCAFTLVACRHPGCSERVLRSAADLHEAALCPWRPELCPDAVAAGLSCGPDCVMTARDARSASADHPHWKKVDHAAFLRAACGFHASRTREVQQTVRAAKRKLDDLDVQHRRLRAKIVAASASTPLSSSTARPPSPVPAVEAAVPGPTTRVVLMMDTTTEEERKVRRQARGIRPRGGAGDGQHVVRERAAGACVWRLVFIPSSSNAGCAVFELHRGLFGSRFEAPSCPLRRILLPPCTVSYTCFIKNDDDDDQMVGTGVAATAAAIGFVQRISVAPLPPLSYRFKFVLHVSETGSWEELEESLARERNDTATILAAARSVGSAASPRPNESGEDSDGESVPAASPRVGDDAARAEGDAAQ